MVSAYVVPRSLKGVLAEEIGAGRKTVIKRAARMKGAPRRMRREKRFIGLGLKNEKGLKWGP